MRIKDVKKGMKVVPVTWLANGGLGNSAEWKSVLENEKKVEKFLYIIGTEEVQGKTLVRCAEKSNATTGELFQTIDLREFPWDGWKSRLPHAERRSMADIKAAAAEKAAIREQEKAERAAARASKATARAVANAEKPAKAVKTAKPAKTAKTVKTAKPAKTTKTVKVATPVKAKVAKKAKPAGVPVKKAVARGKKVLAPELSGPDPVLVGEDPLGATVDETFK